MSHTVFNFSSFKDLNGILSSPKWSLFSFTLTFFFLKALSFAVFVLVVFDLLHHYTITSFPISEDFQTRRIFWLHPIVESVPSTSVSCFLVMGSACKLYITAEKTPLNSSPWNFFDFEFKLPLLWSADSGHVKCSVFGTSAPHNLDCDFAWMYTTKRKSDT